MSQGRPLSLRLIGVSVLVFVFVCASFLFGCGPKHKPVPAKLGIPEIRDGFEQLREQVHECYEKHKVPGHAQVSVSIEADGRVSSVELGQKFAGTPSGECVRQVVLGTRFPPFKEGPIVIQYPLLLR
jgi:hypothetical protein